MSQKTWESVEVAHKKSTTSNNQITLTMRLSAFGFFLLMGGWMLIVKAYDLMNETTVLQTICNSDFIGGPRSGGLYECGAAIVAGVGLGAFLLVAIAFLTFVVLYLLYLMFWPNKGKNTPVSSEGPHPTSFNR